MLNTLRVARVVKPFSAGAVVGACYCGAVVHEQDTHLILSNGTVLCPGCTADRLQHDLITNEKQFVPDILHTVEATPEMLEVFYASFGDAALS